MGDDFEDPDAVDFNENDFEGGDDADFDFDNIDQEEYDFQYESGEEQEPNPDEMDISNIYYITKSKLDRNEASKEALKGFEQVLNKETEPGEWGFKATKQIVKLQFQMGLYDDMMNSYNKLLHYIHTNVVTRNMGEKVINSLLEFVSNCSDMNVLQRFYETTLEALREAKNERLWFKTNLKLGRLSYQHEDFPRLAKILKELHKSCQNSDGSDDMKKGTQLLEIYELEIQMYTATKDNKKLRDLYEKSLQVRSAIPHPRITGVIRECGGKMHMAEQEWEQAKSDFFAAFKHYDEAGLPHRIQCLKYMVLANLLTLSKVNPFEDPATASYKNNPQIVALTDLVGAYEASDIQQFETILNNNRDTIMGDPFIAQYIQRLMDSIRAQVLKEMLVPYTSVKIPFISKELNIPENEVENLLVSLILDEQIKGRIDQVNQVLVLKTAGSKEEDRYNAIGKWANNLQNLHRTITGSLNGY